MTSFTYKAIDINGKTRKGHITSESESEAVYRLRKKELTPVLMKETVSKQERSPIRFGRKRSVKFEMLEFFSRQLSTLLKAGIPVVEAFDSMRQDAELKILANALEQMVKDIENGSTISEVMNKQKAVFPDMYVQMIRAGEAGGVVPETLEELAKMLGSQQETRQTVKNAIRYPMIVCGALIVSFFVLVGFVLPKLSKLFNKFNTNLPLPTRIMLQLNVMLKEHWHLMLIGAVVCIAGAYFVSRLPKIKYLWDRYKIRIPIAGPIVHRIYMERFCQMTNVLLRAGVPVLNVLDKVGSTMNNAFMGDEIKQLSKAVQVGEKMSLFMKQSPAFTNLVAQMAGLGEKSGQLPELFELCAKHYQKEVKYRLKNLLTALEPTLTVVIGIAVLFFMLAVFMPIWDMVKFVS